MPSQKFFRGDSSATAWVVAFDALVRVLLHVVKRGWVALVAGGSR